MTFSELLLSWYAENKRELPWRQTREPYQIWLSEIIMQQTRIGQGTPYFEKFVAAYPTIRHLAAAEEQDVLKLWQGLGYYSRARNMHATAKTIVQDFGAVFPRKYDEIRTLRGIGDYTASAIASICFDSPHAVMDGNVMRFMSRLYGIADSIDLPATKNHIRALATDKMDHQNPGDFNQAMMEFGAMVCTPASPGCMNCPFRGNCIAYGKNLVGEIPVRNSKTVVRNRFIHYLVLTIRSKDANYVYLHKRTGNDIWKNLYDFPSLEFKPGKTDLHLPVPGFEDLFNGTSPDFKEASDQYVHLLTHQKLHAVFYRFHSDKMIELPFLLVPLEDIHQYPVPKLIDRYLLQNSIFPV
ncbi:MAG: A/G-specific adenine glycosylase [Bacteroidetes bacterium]|nr:A/G-specific adenine glycosylase [Bacteroidota bacterium]